MNDIDKELKSKFNLSRNKPVGKKMGSKLWFHKSYISQFIGEKTFKNFTKHLDDDFNYNLIRFDTRTDEVCFIQSPDFDDSHEPIMGESITISLDSDFNFLKKTRKEQDDNPLIYHHKWMMVMDDYKGFNVQDSKERSLEWKELIGINRELSNKIGRLNFWDKLCKDLDLEHRLHQLKTLIEPFTRRKDTTADIPSYFSKYLDKLYENIKERTSTKQKPSIVTLIEKLSDSNKIDLKGKVFLDIGCGRFSDIPEKHIGALGAKYLGIDPYHKTESDNLETINTCINGGADVIMLSNVLNTIDYQNNLSEIEDILKQAKNLLSDDGMGFISIYEGEKKKGETEKTPIDTSKGENEKSFQNRMKTEDYMGIIQKYFPNSIRSGNKIIVSKNPSLDLTYFISNKRTSRQSQKNN